MSNKKEVFAVIMAGGVGTRFWPMSRTSKPKQFLDILGTGQSLIQMTFARLNATISSENILVVTNNIYSGDVREHLPSLPEENVLLEPCMRNTAPCIAYANSIISSRVSNAENTAIVVAPSDHLITNTDEFNRVLDLAFNECIGNPKIITLGIKPSRPDTGYGYIKYSGSEAMANVVEFAEKPNKERALAYLEAGDYCWNSGMFVWSLATINSAFEMHLPKMYASFNSGDKVAEIYKECENISIDYGVMERASNIVVIPADFGWSDLGTWTSLSDHLALDADGNGIIGSEVMAIDSKKNIVVGRKGKTIAIKGLDNFIVIDTEDALLICPKTEEQWVKTLVGQLKDKK
tara:strand:- start:1363 stop:2406 length:1044 start_codon:yes stop_codon:yes gene_type:complete